MGLPGKLGSPFWNYAIMKDLKAVPKWCRKKNSDEIWYCFSSEFAFTNLLFVYLDRAYFIEFQNLVTFL